MPSGAGAPRRPCAAWGSSAVCVIARTSSPAASVSASPSPAPSSGIRPCSWRTSRNLDSVSGASIVELLHELHEQGTTVVVITHDNDLAAELPRRVAIRDGKIVSDSAIGTTEEAA